MNTKIKLGFLLVCIGLASCSLFEDLENKSYRDQTVELLTGATWKVDSMSHWKFTPASGVTDLLFLNYGTFEFLSPDDTKNPGNNSGYLIHRYTDSGIAKIDTMAWEPHGAGTREPDPKPLFDLSIYYKDPNGQPGFFNDDLAIPYNFRINEKNKVNIAGEAKFTQTGITTAEYHYSYHFTR
ncbi:MAG: hypothetical protein ABL895_07500 [Cyclobacteriaceae bacterium]